jgi:hypothetical protein
MANANETLYAAGNPHVPYAAIPADSAYAELDRENSRLKMGLAVLRGELDFARRDLKTARQQAWILAGCLGAVTVSGLLTIGMLLLR